MRVVSGSLLALGILLIGSNVAVATSWHVPLDVATVGEALAAALPGDAVVIAPGTYREHDLVLPAGVSLAGDTADPATVVIDAQGAGRVLAVDDAAAVVSISRLTVTGGDAARGGGLYAGGLVVTLHDVRIVGNRASYGGGVYAEGTATYLEDCAIADNVARAVGGGVFAHGEGHLALTDCAVVRNEAEGYAGGWYASAGARLTLTGSTVADNSAETAAEGAAFAAHDLSFTRTVIAWNCAPHPPIACEGGATGLLADLASVPHHQCSLRHLNGWSGPIDGQGGASGNLEGDPLFCRGGAPDDLAARYGVAGTSPALPAHSGGCGLVGAFSQACDAPTDTPDALPAAACVLFAPTPNPFNPATTIRFSLRESGPVRLEVYDLAGRRVATLVHDDLGAGPHEVVWHGTDDDGLRAASGVYVCRLHAGGLTENRRLALVK
jgi:hypothetical protein